MKTFDEYRKEQLQNPEIKAEYDRLEKEYAGIALQIRKVNKTARNGAIIGTIILHIVGITGLLWFGTLHPFLNVLAWGIIISYVISVLFAATYLCYLLMWEDR